MRQVRTDNYSLAWFKLAECVSRREKERALGVYRLLAHSLHDAAFALQLEGDLQLAFNDSHSALERYRAASNLYHKQHRMVESAAVFEHVVTLDRPSIKNLKHVLDLYASLNIPQKIQHFVTLLVELCLKQHQYEECDQALQTYGARLSLYEQVLVCRATVMAALKNKTPDELMRTYLHKLLDFLVNDVDPHALQRFLAELEMLDHKVHAHAVSYVEHEVKNK